MECPHPTVRADEQRSWLVAESDQHKALCTIVQDKKLTSDLQQLTRFCHTGTLENFHSVLLKWCPKRIHFSYEGMRARSQLACLSHNENVGRAQATTAAGILRHKLVFPKAKGHWVVKKSCTNAPHTNSRLTSWMKYIRFKFQGTLPQKKGQTRLKLSRHMLQG